MSISANLCCDSVWLIFLMCSWTKQVYDYLIFIPSAELELEFNLIWCPTWSTLQQLTHTAARQYHILQPYHCHASKKSTWTMLDMWAPQAKDDQSQRRNTFWHVKCGIMVRIISLTLAGISVIYNEPEVRKRLSDFDEWLTMQHAATCTKQLHNI